jgi:hypothetical protein
MPLSFACAIFTSVVLSLNVGAALLRCYSSVDRPVAGPSVFRVVAFIKQAIVCYNRATVMHWNWAAVLVLTVLFATNANGASDGGVSCAETEQKLSAAQRALSSCNETAQTLNVNRQRCVDELEQTTEKLQSTASRVEVCVNAKEQQCQETAAYAASLLQGTNVPPMAASRRRYRVRYRPN